MLLSEGGLYENDDLGFMEWRKCGFFPEKVLKERFRYYLVKYLREWAKNEVKLFIPRAIKAIWRNKCHCDNLYALTVALYKVIWYVWIGERLDNASFTVGYIGRYAKRPAVSETRIIYYSFEEQTIKFSYRDKIARSFITETISVEEFIGRLIRHIPEKNFRLIRYYGFYANRVKGMLEEILKFQISFLFGAAKLLFEPKTWRERIFELSGKDPLVCPDCQTLMKLKEIAYRTRDGTLKLKAVS